MVFDMLSNTKKSTRLQLKKYTKSIGTKFWQNSRKYNYVKLDRKIGQRKSWRIEYYTKT
jgi:hypothetical protein